MGQNRFVKHKLHQENPAEKMQRIREEMMEKQQKIMDDFLAYKLGFWARMPHCIVKWIFKIERFDNGALNKVWVLKRFGKQIGRIEIFGEIKK